MPLVLYFKTPKPTTIKKIYHLFNHPFKPSKITPALPSTLKTISMDHSHHMISKVSPYPKNSMINITITSYSSPQNLSTK
jgi:hypothetical protein